MEYKAPSIGFGILLMLGLGCGFLCSMDETWSLLGEVMFVSTFFTLYCKASSNGMTWSYLGITVSRI